MKKGFTLIELLVVVGMIAVLMGALTVSVSSAQNRGRIAKATQETKEITNAILAFEQYAVGHTLEKYANGGWSDCTEGSMKRILGGEKGASGEQVPVLFNAAVSGGYLRDPWGRPYQYMIEKSATLSSGQGTGMGNVNFTTSAALPNYFRLTDKERSE